LHETKVHAPLDKELKSLELEIESKGTELAKFERMLREKGNEPVHVQSDTRVQVVSTEAQKLLSRANDIRFEQLSTEINEMKVQIMSMKLATYQDKVMARTIGKRDYTEIEGLTKERLTEMITYTVDEMLTQVNTDIPLIAHQREALENERLMIKQLIANIERNRVKWRLENDAGVGLSVQRRLAM
jgi:hypothetical protein